MAEAVAETDTSKISDIFKTLKEECGEGDSLNKYTKKLNNFVNNELSRKELDKEQRNLLPAKTHQLHNEMLITLLTKFEAPLLINEDVNDENEDSNMESALDMFRPNFRMMCNNSRTSLKTFPIFEHKFQPASCLDYVPVIPEEKDKGNPNLDLKNAISPLDFLPLRVAIFKRMFAAGLNSKRSHLERQALLIILESIRLQIRNILSAIMNQKRMNKKLFKLHFKKRSTFGDSIIKASNARKSSSDQEIDIDTVMEPDESISLFDLYQILKSNRKLIPLHSVYSLNMARIMCQRTHPSYEELKTKEIYQREEFLQGYMDDHF